MRHLRFARLPGGLETVKWSLVLLPMAVAVVGCKSGTFNYYTSPCVTGRVLDSGTQQPLADVRVSRVLGGQNEPAAAEIKGAQVLSSPPAIRTDTEGRFVVNSVKAFSVLPRVGWYSITLSFARAGYETWRTNFTIADVTGQTADGAPEVNAGSIFLHRISP